MKWWFSGGGGRWSVTGEVVVQWRGQVECDR